MAGRIAFEEMIRFDQSRRRPPIRSLAGVDEAGRGALAGPVVAAAVVCDPCPELEGVRDSKLVPEAERERLHDLIVALSSAWSVGIVGPDEIDRINILRATLKAMKAAVEGLPAPPDLVLVDGVQVPDIGSPAVAIPHGDRVSFSVAAASIVAKVTRDRIMRECAGRCRGYGFEGNKGYGTRKHIEAIRALGRTDVHRMSFRVREQLGLDLEDGGRARR